MSTFEVRHNQHRVQLRMLLREKSCLPLHILLGNDHLANRSYTYAAGTYVKVRPILLSPPGPLVALWLLEGATDSE